MVNHESGLLGVSETSPDMRDLLARRETTPRAAEAVALFCYQAKKGIGALAAALGGLDLLVFSGGIGENSPEMRAEICTGLEFLGITLDRMRNRGSDAVITTEQSRTPVRVIRTDEESMIARATASVLASRNRYASRSWHFLAGHRQWEPRGSETADRGCPEDLRRSSEPEID